MPPTVAQDQQYAGDPEGNVSDKGCHGGRNAGRTEIGDVQTMRWTKRHKAQQTIHIRPAFQRELPGSGRDVRTQLGLGRLEKGDTELNRKYKAYPWDQCRLFPRIRREKMHASAYVKSPLQQEKIVVRPRASKASGRTFILLAFECHRAPRRRPRSSLATMSSEPDIQHNVAAWLRGPKAHGSLPPSSPPPAPSSPAARPSGFEVHRDVPGPEPPRPTRDDPFGFFAAERRLRTRPPSSRASTAATAAVALRDRRPSSPASVPEDHSRRSPSSSSAVSRPTRAPLRTKAANAPISRTADSRPSDKPGEPKATKTRKGPPIPSARAAQAARRRAKKPVKQVSEDAEEIVLPPEVDEEEEQRKRIEYFKTLDKYELRKEDVYII